MSDSAFVDKVRNVIENFTKKEGLVAFQTRKGRYYVEFEDADEDNYLPLDCGKVKEILTAEIKRLIGRCDYEKAYKEAKKHLKSKAELDEYRQTDCLRTALDSGEFLIDTRLNPERYIAIRKGDWAFSKESEVVFHRPLGMLPLPDPKRGGDHNLLWKYVNLATANDRLLFLNWLLSSMIASQSYAIAFLRGQQGCGKSTSASFARQFIDPQEAPKRNKPSSVADMMAHAEDQFLLFYDNVSKIPDWMSDLLCLLSEGAGHREGRKGRGEGGADTETRRPIVITSIANVLTKGDVLDRSLIFDLSPIPAENRRSREEMQIAFRKDAPAIYGGLLTLLAKTLSKESEVRTKVLPRMADHARMGIALEEVLGLPQGAYLDAYRDNHDAGGAISVDSSSLLRGLQKFVLKSRPFEGQTAELLDSLERIVKKVDRGPDWPKLPNQLSSELRRLMPNAHLAGFRIGSKRVHGYTIWTIETI